MSQLAFHPMFKISSIHQHTSFNPKPRSRRSLGLRTVRDMPLHTCAWTSTFKQLRCKFVQSKRFSSWYHNSQWSIPIIKVKKISINVLTYSVSITSEIFYDIARYYKPDRQWRSSSFQESKKVRVSRDLWPWPWAHPGCTLSCSPSCESLVAIRPFACEKKRFAQKFTDGRTDDGHLAIV